MRITVHWPSGDRSFLHALDAVLVVDASLSQVTCENCKYWTVDKSKFSEEFIDGKFVSIKQNRCTSPKIIDMSGSERTWRDLPSDVAATTDGEDYY